MPKYHVTFEDKKLIGLEPVTSSAEVPTDSHEERTGSHLTATIEAKDEHEAQEKARALEQELQSGMPKERIHRKEDNDTGK